MPRYILSLIAFTLLIHSAGAQSPSASTKSPTPQKN